MKNKRLFIILSIVVTLLLIPIIAMQFTDKVNWTLFDFGLAGALLLGAGVMCEIIIRKVRIRNFQIALCLALLILLFLIWTELAVGIYGTSIGGN